MTRNDIIRSVSLALIVLSLAPTHFAQEGTEVERDEGNLVNIGERNVAVNKAMAKARSTLPSFWGLMEQFPEHTDLFSIKVGLPTSQGSMEHIWVGSLQRSGDTISGRLENEPFDLLADLNLGDEVEFRTEQVSDWSVWDNGKQYGAFTVRAMVDFVDEELAAELRDSLHEPAIPEFSDQ